MTFMLALLLAVTQPLDTIEPAAWGLRNPTAQESADSGAFVVRLGTDTISIERYTRRGNRLEAVAVGRSPRTVVARLALTLGPDGSVATLGAGRGPGGLEERAPAVAGTIPIAGGFWVLWELHLSQIAQP